MFARIAGIAALCGCALIWSGEQAAAALIKLTYSGSEIPLVSPPPDFRDTYPAFSGEIVLNENLLGGSVAGRTLTFFGQNSPSDPNNRTDGIVSWTHGVPLYAVGGTDVSITFDTDRNVIGWRFDALDGPPDFLSSSGGDAVFGGNGGFYRTDAGTWDTAVIPLPPALAGLAAGLVLLAGLGRQRARRRSPRAV